MCDCEKKSGNFLTGLVLGALAGVGLVYFLTSTKEGKKIKEQIEEKGSDVLDELQDLVADLEEKSLEFKAKAAKVEEALEDKATAGADVALSQIEKLRVRGRSAVKSFVRNGKPLTNS